MPKKEGDAKKDILTSLQISLPFPYRVKNSQRDMQFKKFLEVMSKVHINLPFVKAISHMSSYAKHLKEILSNKGKLANFGTMGLNEDLTPYSFFKKLSITDLEPTNIFILLIDHSVVYPRGVIEDVLVKVNKFIFLANFVILDMEVDEDIPIILGQPFLSTFDLLVELRVDRLTL